MRHVTALLLLAALASFVWFAEGRASAEERSIYVGDVVELRVSAPGLTKDELLAAFRAFEYAEAEADGDGYIVTLRTFEPGEKKVTLGDKEIVIVAGSMLEDFPRDGPYEGDPAPLAPGFRPEWLHAVYALAAVFLASGAVLLRRALPKRRAAPVRPYEQFRGRIDGLSESDERFAALLTLHLKEYLEAVFARPLRGKTSAELAETIGELPGMRERAADWAAWLAACDRLKYTGAVAPAADLRRLRDWLAELAGALDAAQPDGRAAGGPDAAKGRGA